MWPSRRRLGGDESMAGVGGSFEEGRQSCVVAAERDDERIFRVNQPPEIGNMYESNYEEKA